MKKNEIPTPCWGKLTFYVFTKSCDHLAAIFNDIEKMIAPVDVKKYLKLYLQKLKFLLLRSISCFQENLKCSKFDLS